MRKEPIESAEMVSQLLFGECGCALEYNGNFLFVENLTDSYKGWVDTKMVTELMESEFVSMRRSSVFKVVEALAVAYSICENAAYRLTMGSILPNYDESTHVFGVGSRMFNIEPQFVARELVPNGEKLVSTAKKMLNTPYLWGGKNVFGMDCSGFVQVVYAVLGIDLPRDASMQIGVGREVKYLEEAQTGDLAFFEKNGRITHVGMLISKNQIIHASGKVKIEKIDHEGIISHDTGKHTHYLVAIRRVFSQ